MTRTDPLSFCLGVAAGFGLKALCDMAASQRPRTRRQAGPHRRDHVRDSGRSQMQAPPRSWDIVDEQGDESFPASDPPGNY